MNSEVRDLIFRAKNLRRQELAAMPIADKFRLIEALHTAGMHLRKIRPQVGSVGVTMRRSRPSVFQNVQEPEIVELNRLSELMAA